MSNEVITIVVTVILTQMVLALWGFIIYDTCKQRNKEKNNGKIKAS